MVSWALQQLVCAYMCPIAPLHDDSSKKSMNVEMKKKKRKVNTDQVNTLTRSVLLSYLYYISSSPAWWDILAFFHTPEVSSEKHQTVLSSTPISFMFSVVTLNRILNLQASLFQFSWRLQRSS